MNLCWTFCGGSMDDLAWDITESKIYMNPSEVVAKIKDIRADIIKDLVEHPEYFKGKVHLGIPCDDAETFLKHCGKPNTRLNIYIDDYQREWVTCREIKW